MTTYYKPKQIVTLNEAENGIWHLINNHIVWCEKEFAPEDSQHVFLSVGEYTTKAPNVRLAIVQRTTLNNLFKNDLIGCYKVCEGYYKFFNKLEREIENESIDPKIK